ncbi:two-component sensor histidine kinase [Roseobacter cerasinus]|uniref:histidine kinase n=1 Tax=Roseobacter cerasinus TaxID=2602289 RepID=A0A640VRS7_9RHOB|nr:ATP-binding protein [Roseobacter cerasinus]GFE50382.1 two-component sensor histidine kinase [Roseobacter cerasinus]
MSFAWLKYYMPRSLYARAVMILLLPVVVLQLVVTVLFLTRHFEDVTQQMATTVARELRLVLDVVESAPDLGSINSYVIEELSQLAIVVEPVAEGDVPQAHLRDFWDFSGRVIVAMLPAQVQSIAAIDLTENRRVHVYADTRFGPVKIGFDRRRISASNPHQLFVNMIFFGGLVTVIAILYLRNQLRPIKRLARAAEAFGRGRHEPYSPAGALEVRAAGHAFLDMRNRIERQIEQRTLMLSGVSHDLRTPLTRMRLSLSMLEEDERAALEQDVDDMQGMLDAFLNFVKGAGEGEPEPIEPHAFVASVVEDARRAGRDVALLPPDGEGTGTVQLNPLAMRRALDNLISNAVRYGAMAEVSVLMTEKALRIRVEDDGPGIPEDRRAEATRPFTRLDAARNQDRGGGVGLGLAIATDIARAHGGVLRLSSSERLGGLRADIVIAR